MYRLPAERNKKSANVKTRSPAPSTGCCVLTQFKFPHSMWIQLSHIQFGSICRYDYVVRRTKRGALRLERLQEAFRVRVHDGAVRFFEERLYW